jgi:sec-independent protein translocase protein TatC
MARPRRVDPEDQLTLTEHLDELRSRLVVSVSVLVVVIALAFWQWKQLLHWLAKPAEAAIAPHHLKFLQTSPTDAFFTAFSLSLDIAILVTLPLLTYQIYAFVIPAFSREHHKRIRSLALMIPVLFVLGVAFGWFLVLPPALDFLLNFGGSDFAVNLRATEYLQFITLLLIAMGVIFEMPAFMYTLAKMRIINAAFMRRTWRYAVVLLAVVAGVLPGADPISFVFEFAPLLVLYAFSYLLVKMVDRNRSADEETESRWGDGSGWEGV